MEFFFIIQPLTLYAIVYQKQHLRVLLINQTFSTHTKHLHVKLAILVHTKHSVC